METEGGVAGASSGTDVTILQNILFNSYLKVKGLIASFLNAL